MLMLRNRIKFNEACTIALKINKLLSTYDFFFFFFFCNKYTILSSLFGIWYIYARGGVVVGILNLVFETSSNITSFKTWKVPWMVFLLYECLLIKKKYKIHIKIWYKLKRSVTERSCANIKVLPFLNRHLYNRKRRRGGRKVLTIKQFYLRSSKREISWVKLKAISYFILMQLFFRSLSLVCVRISIFALIFGNKNKKLVSESFEILEEYCKICR